MTDEEAPGIVDQQLVELGGDRFRHAKAVRHTGGNGVEGPPPVPPDVDAVRRDLPGSPHRRIDQGLLTAPVRCGFRLDLQQRQGDRPDAIHLQ